MRPEEQVIAELKKFLQEDIVEKNGDIKGFVMLCASTPSQRDSQIALLYLSRSSLVTDDFKKTPIIKIGENELCLNDISSFEVGALGDFLNKLSTRKVAFPVLELQSTAAHNNKKEGEEPFYCNCTFEQALKSDVCMGRSGKMGR